jgi:hypothetical protein
MAILDPLTRSANSVQPVVIMNKLINKIFFIFYFSFGITHPALLRFSYTFAVGDINMSVSVAVITDRFIRHYKSLVYPLWHPYLGSKGSFFSFLSLHNMHCLSDVSFSLVLFFFLSYVLVDNEK